MYSWVLDQLWLTGIGMQRVYLLVICWLICLREQTFAYATAQIAEKFHQSFLYPKTWRIWNNWTMNTLNLSGLQAFQHFFPACKIRYLKTGPKELIRFLSECSSTYCKETFRKYKKDTSWSTETKFTNCLYEEQLGSNEEVYFCPKKIIALKNTLPLRH